MEENLRKYIDELIQEVEQELDEATTTAGVDGYQTPFAFGGGRDKDKKKQKRNIDVTGYTKVKDIDESVNEAMVSPKNGHQFFQLTKDTPIKFIKSQSGMNAPGVFLHNKDGFIKGKKDAYLIDYFGAAFYVDLKNKFASKIYPMKDQTDLRYNSNFKETDKAPEMSDWKKFLKESVNEAKVKRPVNRWLELKNDDTMHPHKKMAHGLKELKYQLAETEKFFKWYNKIKNINELESSNYWKRTQSHIYKIKERLVNIARTIQEIEK